MDVRCVATALMLVWPGVATAEPESATRFWVARGSAAMVASDSPEASAAGVEILKAGGNAIDAAVAVSFALAVTRPYSTGLGGGGFMIARFADGRVVVQDFREAAPMAATRDMYAEVGGGKSERPDPSVIGYRAVAVPGLVAGRCEALERYGTMPLERVVGPAVRLARDGFRVDAHYVDTTREVHETYVRFPQLKQTHSYVYRVHLREGNLWAAGEKLTQPALGKLIESIGAYGAAFFYEGPVAEAIARDMTAQGGLITKADLAGYRTKWREPIRSTYGEYEIIGMPPPSSGGVALAQTLNILGATDFRSLAKSDVPAAVHLQIEALKHAFADRARWLGDADFAEVPVDRLISPAYARQLASRIKPDATLDPDRYGTVQLPDDAGTSHFCVVDRFGNAVVSTETINTGFGSLAALDAWGLILNNEMDDFVSRPGEPNAYGLIQSSQNAIEPGKRPLSSMSPTIVLRNGEPYLLLGASGGPRIISSVLNVLLGMTDYGRSLEEAMAVVRPHHQWKPDAVYFDAEPAADLAGGLKKRGHTLSDKRRTGIVQAIVRTKEGWMGASDPRKSGRPAGY